MVTTSFPALPSQPTAANQQIVPEVQPKVDLPGPQFMARDHVDPKARKVCQDYAEKLADDKGLDVMFFIKLIEAYGLSNVPGLDAMLENIKARDAGEVGKRTLNMTGNMRKLNHEIPAIDPKFIEKVKSGKAKMKEVVNLVEWFTDQIKKFLNQYQSMLKVMNQDISILEDQYKTEIEATLRDDNLKKEAEERQGKLLELCTVLEFLQEDLGTKIEAINQKVTADPNNKAQLDERTRLTSVSPLVLQRLGGVKPMVFNNQNNIKRFIDQRNANAIVAISLGDFLEIGVPQWKTDVVSELDAKQASAAMLALRNVVEFAKQQSVAADNAYVEQMQQVADLLSQMMTDVQTMQHKADAVVAAGDAVNVGTAKAAKVNADTATAIEAGRNQVKASEDKLSADLAKIMKGAGATA